MNWNILGKAAFCSAGFMLVVFALVFLFPPIVFPIVMGFGVLTAVLYFAFNALEELKR